MSDPFDTAKRRYPALRQRFNKAGEFLGYALPLWAARGKTWCMVHLDPDFRAFWSNGWEHIWHWAEHRIFRVTHHGPETYGASTFHLNF